MRGCSRLAPELRLLNSVASRRQSPMPNHRSAVRAALLRWYGRHARSLPWRRTRDPYRVWVSEVMLQQTQVATVIPYYRRFLHVFPTLQRLAQAPLERVLELWSGLGYYRRARHLHLAARKVVQDFNGRFPADFTQARTLPGVGDYTARAVLSIAYHLPYSVLDGNVARVVARLLALRGSLNQPSFRRVVEGELDGLLSRRQPSNFNQALMELGQTVCLPRVPRCEACPVRRWFRAYHLREPESYPKPKPRRATESHVLAVAIIGRSEPLAQTHVALIRGLDDGLMADLWNFPAAFGCSHREAFDHLREKLVPLVRGPLHWMSARPRAQLKHGITYRSILVDLYPAKVPGALVGDTLRWFRLSQLPHRAVSQLARKIATRISTADEWRGRTQARGSGPAVLPSASSSTYERLKTGGL